MKRQNIVSSFYERADEETRLQRSRHGQLEYYTTMAMIRRYAGNKDNVLEIGAGTGRYSVALARSGMNVTAVELVERNCAILKENSVGLENIHVHQGDATDLSCFNDGVFDLTLSLGPMYHLYDKDEVCRAIDEAIRVTKPGGVIMFAFLSVYGIMFSNYMRGNWKYGQDENFTVDGKIRHFAEQLFTGYDIEEFEGLFADKPVVRLTTCATDGILESIEQKSDFSFTDEEFRMFADWYLRIAEKRELLGCSNHLLYVCKKI